MQCPIYNFGNSEVLLDYCAKRLPAARAEEIKAHVATCSQCSAFVHEQTSIWDSLDGWEGIPASDDFDKKVYARIEQTSDPDWWRSLVAWRPALSLGAVCAAMAMLFVVNEPRNQPPAQPPAAVTESAAVETVEAEQPEQVERALEDLEMLKQLSGNAGHTL